MGSPNTGKTKLALVYGNLPTVEEVDQFMLVANQYDVTVISSESICGYLTQTSFFQDLRCIVLPDHEENTTFLPGLEKVLAEFDVVVVKERTGLYAYQAVKAKWRNRFRLVVWVDNGTAFPGEDINQLRTLRVETSNAADAFLVQSKTASAALQLEGIEEDRIYRFSPHIGNRVTRTGKERAKAAQMLGLNDTDYIISHFGQVEWEETLFDLVSALKLIEGSDPKLASRLKIVFCGIGSLSTELRNRLVLLGLDRNAVYVAPSREAFETILTATDAMYYSTVAARDRLEAEPYRLVTAMANKIPIIASRSCLVEEFIGKHRIDFCTSSPDSLAKAIKKAATSRALTQSIASKNYDVVKAKMTKTKISEEMLKVFANICKQDMMVDINALDRQVPEIEALVQSKQYLAAIDLIESMFQLENMPTHHKSNLYRLIGDCFTKLGDGDSGKNAYQKAVEFDGFSAKAFIGLGTVSLTKNSFETAVPHFQKAVSLSPEDEMANLGLGLAFNGLGEYEEANKWVTKALKLNPENTAALFTLVQIANVRDKYKDAEGAIEKYCTLHPHDHNMAYSSAVIKHKLKKNEESLQIIDRILAVDPQDARVSALKMEITRSTTKQAKAEGSH
jgi:tetratricopeptide (TPR) repeat protein